MSDSDIDPTFHLKIKSVEVQTKEYKEYRRRWNENPANFIVDDFPLHVDLELNTSCNLKCYMCFHSFDAPEPVCMDTGLFKKILDEGSKKGLCAIKTQYRGEPLLNKNLPTLVKYAKDKGILEVMFNTNANLLSEEMSKSLINAGLDKLICSVDGYTKQIYEQIRIGGQFDTVLLNIKNLQKIKKEIGSSIPIVRVQMVDTPKNHHQIDGYIEFWGKIVEHVAVEDMLDWKAEKEDNTPLEDWFCAQLWQRLLILADGDVLPCCRATRGGNEKLMVLGNARDTSLEDLWKGEKLQKLRDIHQNGKSHEVRMCRLCGLRKQVINKKLQNNC